MALPESWKDAFEPLPGYVLIEREESPDHTASGLIIPERYRKNVKRSVAVVVRSGDLRVAPGDIVLVAEGAGRRLQFGDYPATVYYLVTYAQLRCRFASVECVDGGWADVETSETMYRQHLRSELFLVREDVADEGRSTAIGDQRARG